MRAQAAVTQPENIGALDYAYGLTRRSTRLLKMKAYSLTGLRLYGNAGEDILWKV